MKNLLTSYYSSNCVGHTDYLSSGFEGTGSNPGGIAIGFYNGMWAYDGWNNLNYVTEEIVNPHRYATGVM